MQDKTFEDFLQQYHSDNNSEVLDDDLPDHYEDWVGNLSGEEVMELAEKAIIYYQKIYCSVIEKEKERIFNGKDFSENDWVFNLLRIIQDKIKGKYYYKCPICGEATETGIIHSQCYKDK